MSKKRYKYKKAYRCVGEEGDVFFRDTKKEAGEENHFGLPMKVWAVIDGENDAVVADAYEVIDAKMIRNALNAAGIGR